MRCGKVKRLLSPFIDGEFSKEQSQEVAAHLERCAGCRTELESLMELESLGHDLPSPEPGEVYWQTFLPRLRTRISQEEEKPQPGRIREALGRFFAPPVPWIRLAGAVATAVLVFFVGRAMYQHEVRMRGIRALPKQLLTDQARQMEEATRGEKSISEQTIEQLAEEELALPREAGRADAEMDELAGKEVTPAQPSDERSLETAGTMRSKKEDLIAPVPPISLDKAPAAGDLSTTLEPDIHEDKMRRFAATSEDVLESAENKGAAAGAGLPDPEHWRDQIQTWQDFIEENPRDDRLRDAHLRLADSWFQLARLTEEEQDLLRALEAQRVALDFADQEPVRQLLRDRIQLLEEQL